MQGSAGEAMAVDFSLTFLGTGTSVGVPVIGCDCGVCTSEDPRNKRTRSSVVLRAGGVTLLVDSGPDLRMQALREGLRRVDAVLYTHEHVDHVVGFDELRAFCWGREEPLPLHATEECMQMLKVMFGWAFSGENLHAGYVRPAVRVIDGPFFFGDLRVTPLPVIHAAAKTVGFLFEHPAMKSAAYLPDVKSVPDATLDLLRGVDVLVIDALRPGMHPTHFSTAEALEFAEQASAGETWLTHLSHENEHVRLGETLPDGVRVAWDGQRLPLAALA